MNGAARIQVHIERLVLDGFGTEPGHAARIGRAVERELARSFASAPADALFSAGGVAVPHLAVPEIRPTARESPERVGARIAAAVQAGFDRGTR